MECQYLNCCEKGLGTNEHISVGFWGSPRVLPSPSGFFCLSLGTVAIKARFQDSRLSEHRVQSILIGLAGVSVFIPLNMVAKKR